MPAPVTQAKKSKLREDHCALDTYVMHWCSSSFDGRTMHIEMFNVRAMHIEVFNVRSMQIEVFNVRTMHIEVEV